MSERPPSSLPKLGQKETEDWHPDEQLKESDPPLDFTSEQCDAIQTYIWEVRDMLGLRNWDIFLSAVAAREGTNATIHPVYGRHIAALAVNQDWWSYPPEVQRNTIVHELLHVVHNRQTEVIRTAPTSGWMWATFERETELMVDHLANIIEYMFPMPPKNPSPVKAVKDGK